MLSEMNSLRDIVGEILNKLRNAHNVCLITHKNADPDAVASVIAFKQLIESIDYLRNISTYIIFPEGIELVSKNIITALNININDVMKDMSKNVIDCDIQIILDTASESQLGNYLRLINNYIVIDHHDVNTLINNSQIALYDSSASSTSELVSLMYMVLNLRPKSYVASLLLSGIIYDTRFFRVSVRPQTFNVIYWLLTCGAMYSLVIEAMTRKEIPYAEKVARLKAALRAGLYAVNDYLLAITCIGAYESSALKVLQDAGADIAIAIARRGDQTRVTIRASKRVLEHISSSLAADLANILGKEFKGSGGGHGAAAGALLRDFDCEQFTKVLRKFFEDKGYKFRILDEGRWKSECGN